MTSVSVCALLAMVGVVGCRGDEPTSTPAPTKASPAAPAEPVPEQGPRGPDCDIVMTAADLLEHCGAQVQAARKGPMERGRDCQRRAGTRASEVVATVMTAAQGEPGPAGAIEVVHKTLEKINNEWASARARKGPYALELKAIRALERAFLCTDAQLESLAAAILGRLP